MDDGLKGYTVAEAAQRATISTKQMYREVKAGHIRVVRVGARIVIPATSLRAFLEGLPAVPPPL